MTVIVKILIIFHSINTSVEQSVPILFGNQNPCIFIEVSNIYSIDKNVEKKYYNYYFEGEHPQEIFTLNSPEEIWSISWEQEYQECNNKYYISIDYIHISTDCMWFICKVSNEEPIDFINENIYPKILIKYSNDYGLVFLRKLNNY